MEELKSKDAIGLEATAQRGEAFMYASEELNNNEATILKAVAQRGEALDSESAEQKSNQAIALQRSLGSGMRSSTHRRGPRTTKS